MSAGDVDYLFPSDDFDTGGLSRDEVLGRGRNTDLIEDKTVALAEARVRKSGVLEMLDKWTAEDRGSDGLGGRPRMISSRAILTALLLLARESSPMHVRRAALLLQVRLSPESQDLLGLPRINSAFVDPIVSKDRWYNNTMRAFQRMNALMDPYPQERYTSKTYEQIQEILDDHDPIRAEKYRARLNDFTRRFLRMTVMEQPRAIRRQFRKLDVSFDQTYVGTPTTRGYSHNTIGERIAVERRTADFGKLSPGPVDAFTGWHIANGERTDYTRNETDKTNPKDKDNGKVYEWGWVANLAVRVDSEAPGSGRFPTLVVAASLSIPNREVAEEAVDLLRAATTLDMEPGVADADKQYWVGSTTTRLLKPALQTGFTPSTDYRKDQLGVKGGQHGALAAEGVMYCPSTEKKLLTASEDLQNGIIDVPTYRQRIDGRKAFALHVKQKAPTPDGNTILRCPALGPSPTVTCPLRELMKTATPKARPHVEPESLDEEMLDTICRKHSASFNLTEMQQPAQAFDYGSKEWEDFHEHARNTVESENEQLKAAGDEDIETAGRRRVRGISAAQIIITLLLVNHNIRKIAAFLDDQFRRERKNNPTEPTPLRRRDRAWQNKYTKTTGDGDLRVRNTKELRRANDPVPLRT